MWEAEKTDRPRLDKNITQLNCSPLCYKYRSLYYVFQSLVMQILKIMNQMGKRMIQIHAEAKF